MDPSKVVFNTRFPLHQGKSHLGCDIYYLSSPHVNWYYYPRPAVGGGGHFDPTFFVFSCNFVLVNVTLLAIPIAEFMSFYN